MNEPVRFLKDGKRRIPRTGELGFDPAEIRRRYDYERDRRLHANGAAQYQNIDGDLAHYIDDPHVTGRIEPAPVTEDVEVASRGAGFGGLLMAARLHEAGIRDFRIIERGGLPRTRAGADGDV